MKKRINRFLKFEYGLLFVIVVIGAYLRFSGIFTNSFAFTYDVGRDLLVVWNIVYLHKVPLIGATTGLQGIFYGPWWYYFLTPFFVIFSGNPEGVAFSMALVGVFSIVLGFCLGKKVSGTVLALLLSAFIAASPALVSLSSQIWNPDVTPMLALLILIVLDKIYKEDKRQRLNYFLLGILLCLSLDLEIVYGILLAAGIALSLLLFAKKDDFFKKAGSFILGFLVILLPRIAFELRHNFLMTKSLIGIFTHGLGHGSQVTTVSSYLSIRTGTVLDQFNSTLALGNMTLGLIVLVFMVVLLPFLYKRAERHIKLMLNTALITILVFIIGVLFLTHDIWPHYLVGLPVFFILVLAIELTLLYKINKAVPILLGVVLFTINLNPVLIIDGFNRPLWTGNASIYRNQLQVIDYVYHQADGKNFKYVVYTPPVFDYTYRYLFKWYGSQKYHYLPSQKADLAFFIIEPDPGFEGRLRQWLKLREHDGIIVKSKQFPSGIVVQTRAVH